MDQKRADLARRLFNIGAVKFGAFRLKLHETHPDAPLSPIYFNLRTADNPKPGPLGAEELKIIGAALSDCIESHYPDRLAFDGLCPVPNAGDPLVDAMNQYHANHPMPVIRLRKAGTTDHRRVVGVADAGLLELGSVVLVVDDLITGADSKLEAINVLELEGFCVEDVLVLIDREQGGREQLAQKGYMLHTVFTLSALLDFYVEEKLLDPTKREEIAQYLANASA